MWYIVKLKSEEIGLVLKNLDLTAKLSGVSIPVLLMRLPDGSLWQRIEQEGPEEKAVETQQKEEKKQREGRRISVGGNATFEAD